MTPPGRPSNAWKRPGAPRTSRPNQSDPTEQEIIIMAAVQYKYQSVRDFVAAMQRGDSATAERIAHEIVERNKRRAAPGELSELSWANASTPLGKK